MYKIYTTEAIVLGGRPSREADKVLTLLTRDLGLIQAVAKGVRKEASKLRYALADRSQGLVSLVRGKDVWRITNILPQSSYANRGEVARMTARVGQLAKRLVPPEAVEETLFDTYATFLELSLKPKIDIASLEILAVLHILRVCGYVGNNPALEQIFTRPFSEEVLPLIATERSLVLETINNALHHSHL